MRMLALFFFNDTATTEIYTLSLHDALPIYDPGVPAPDGDADLPHHPAARQRRRRQTGGLRAGRGPVRPGRPGDRKSTRLNSSHANISYAVFCLKKNQYRLSP